LLSGGERNRVQLARLLRRGGNLLVLDEPTNDLDLPTLGALEEGLVAFPGCALIVSHDRWFLDRVATSILAFEGNGKVVRRHSVEYVIAELKSIMAKYPVKSIHFSDDIFNLNKAWIGQPLAKLAGTLLNRQVVAINDADAAGLAELQYGAARGVAGTVLLLTLGTGIGSALFVDGRLVPNTELGHLQVAGREAEKRASGRAKVEGALSWDAWAAELNLVINEMHALLWPDLIVLCGGITEEPEKFMDKLHCEARLCVGALRSEAGIVGAAFATTVSSAKI